ncbi:hypothetical protein D9M70_597540 [compost metagenome]
MQYLIGEGSLHVDDNVARANCLCDFNLVGGRNASNHRSAPQPDDLCQKQADTTGRRMDERGVSRLDRVEIGGEVARGQSLHHDGGRRLVINRAGKSYERVR